MQKARNVTGLIVGLFFLLSCVAHGYLGWKAQAAELGKINAPADLMTSLCIGWLFGSFAMFAFGVIACTYFMQRMRGGSGGSIFPILVISLIYVGFGVWATTAGGTMHFLFLFILPGVLLLLAAL